MILFPHSESFSEALKTPAPYLLIGFSFLYCAICAYATIASTACSEVTIKDFLENETEDDEEKNTAFLNLWMQHCDRIKVTLAVIQALTILLFSSCVTSFFYDCFPVGEGSEMFFGLAISVFFLIFTFYIPWFIGFKVRLTLPRRHFKFLKLLADLCWPLNFICLNISKGVVRKAGIEANSNEVFHSGETLSTLIKEESENNLEKNEYDLIQAVFLFGETIAREAMTPRPKMLAVSKDTETEEAFKQAVAENRTRVPVYDGTIDHICGILYISDILPKISGDDPLPPITELMRPAFFIPETKKLSELLMDMRKSGTQIAVVVDEYGGTAGLITSHDITAEIIGEMPEGEHEISQLDEKTFVVKGTTLVDDLNDQFKLDIPAMEGYDSIGGYVMYMLDHLPEGGEVINGEKYSLKVAEVKGRSIENVVLTLRENS